MAAGRKRRILAISFAAISATSLAAVTLSRWWNMSADFCLPDTRFFVSAYSGTVHFGINDLKTARMNGLFAPGFDVAASRQERPTFDWTIPAVYLDQTVSPSDPNSYDFQFVRSVQGWLSFTPTGKFVFTAIRMSGWPIPLLSAIAAIALWRSAPRKHRPHHCPCGYDLTATPPTSPCPECGRVPRPIRL